MEDIKRRLEDRDITLAQVLTLGMLLRLYREVKGVFEIIFILTILIPERTFITRKFLTKNEWKPRAWVDYVNYIANLLSYFDDKGDKEGIEEIKRLILRENVDVMEILSLKEISNSYVLELLLDLNPYSIKKMLDSPVIRKDPSLLAHLITKIKSKIPKEDILKMLSQGRITTAISYEGGISIIAVVESGAITFEDLYYLIHKTGRQDQI